MPANIDGDSWIATDIYASNDGEYINLSGMSSNGEYIEFGFKCTGNFNGGIPYN